MSAASAAVAPLGRLLWSRRLALPALGLSAFGAFLGWVGAMVHLDRLPPMERDARLPALLAASALVMLPAVAGLFAGDALAQLARRPSLRLLPGLRARLSGSLFALAGATSLAAALLAAPFRAELGPLAGVGPAALGFALGAHFPGRARGGSAWLAAFALPLFADPLCALAGRALFAAGMTALAAGLLAWLVASLLRPGVELARGVTWLEPLAPAAARRARRRDAPRPALEPPARIADLRGWRAAHRFEQATAGSAILTPMGGARFYLVCAAVSLIAPTLQGLSGEVGLLAGLLEVWVGPREARALFSDSVQGTVVMVLWAHAAVVAVVSAAPLVGSLLYPLSRRELAELAFSVGLRSSLRACATALGLGALFALGASAWVGRPWPDALPSFAWVALVGLASAPWMQALWLVVARRLRRRQDPVGWAVFLAGLIAPVFALRGLWWLWVELAERRLTAPLVVGYLAALVCGLLLWRPLLRRHFARCDLVG